MAAIRKELREIAKIEGSKQLQNVAALRRVAERDDLEERLARLDADGRGWFNTLPAGALQEPAVRGGKGKGAGGGSAAGPPGDGFTSVGGAKRGGKGKVNSSKAKAKSSNPFDLLS